RQVQFLPLGYLPDTSWHVLPHAIYPFGVPTIFFNVAGVLFYTDVVDLAEDFVAIRSISAVWGLLNSSRLAFTVEVALGRILGLSANARAADQARLQSGWASGLLLGFI